MSLAEKMFARGMRSCPIRSACKRDADRSYYDSLFETDWEVFVVRRDADRDDFRWFTLCCERSETGYEDRDHRTPLGC
jgi:hypothetical protein